MPTGVRTELILYKAELHVNKIQTFFVWSQGLILRRKNTLKSYIAEDLEIYKQIVLHSTVLYRGGAILKNLSSLMKDHTLWNQFRDHLQGLKQHLC